MRWHRSPDDSRARAYVAAARRDRCGSSRLGRGSRSRNWHIIQFSQSGPSRAGKVRIKRRIGEPYQLQVPVRSMPAVTLVAHQRPPPWRAQHATIRPQGAPAPTRGLSTAGDRARIARSLQLERAIVAIEDPGIAPSSKARGQEHTDPTVPAPGRDVSAAPRAF